MMLEVGIKEVGGWGWFNLLGLQLLQCLDSLFLSRLRSYYSILL